MIVDTSALIAVAREEEGHRRIADALLAETGLIPAVVIHEFRRVIALPGNVADPDAEALLDELCDGFLAVAPFTHEDADFAAKANPLYGTGNGKGGALNFVDLMVYGMARRTDLPILCTGQDFAGTDIPIHPASRGW